MADDMYSHSSAPLDLFRQKVTAVRRRAGRLQSELADALGINTQVLSRKLHGTRQSFPTHTEVKQIIKALAAWDAISTQAEANEFLLLMGLKMESFSKQEWNTTPLNRLEPLPVQQSDSASGIQSPSSPSPLSRAHSSFPVPATSLIGRESHLQLLLERLRQPTVRLLTLRGTGGVGKTRLALEVARVIQDDFADGVFFVPLATVRDSALALSTIIQTLHISEPLSSADPDRQSVLSYKEVLKEFLYGKDLLLILDNVEQIQEMVPFIEELLNAMAALKIMVTSRTTLHIYGEHEFEVPPLDVGISQQAYQLDDVLQLPAIRLFVERAQAVYPAFRITEQNASTCMQICVRLDGIPLAIELAAVRAKVLPLSMILQRLSAGMGQSLTFLRSTARNTLPRYQTLYKTLDWSYGLLDPPQQCFFRRLSVFLGGWTLEAATALGTVENQIETLDDVLLQIESLIDHSLVQRLAQDDGNQGPRFYYLETIREYGLAQLAACGELESLQRQHAIYYLTLVESKEAALGSREQSVVVAELLREQDNVRAALTWAFEHGEAEIAQRFCGALGLFWEALTLFQEAHRWIDAALQMTEETPVTVRAKLLMAASRIALWKTACERSRELAQQAFELYESIDDISGKAFALFQIGDTWHMQGEYTLATRYFEESLPLLSKLGEERSYAFALSRLGAMATLQGNLSQAWAWLHEAIPLLQEYSEPGLLNITFVYLGILCFLRSEVEQSIAHLREGLLLAQQTGNRYMLAMAAITFGCVLGVLRGPAYAARVCGAGEALLVKLHTTLPDAYRPMYEMFLGSVRSQTDETTWNQWWHEGQVLSEDALCSLILTASENEQRDLLHPPLIN